MTIEFPGDRSIDYFPCRYGRSRLLFRGPRADMGQPYVAFLGGSETFGKFTDRPFPGILADQGFRCVNLGHPNAGPDAWLNDPESLAMATKAAAVVIALPGAANLSNRLYSVHPRRNDRFLQPSALLRALYRGVDFSQANFTHHLLQLLLVADESCFSVVVDEMRLAWVARMKTLIAALPSPVILLDLERDPLPGLPPICQSPDAAMVDALRPMVRAVINVRPSEAAQAAGASGLHFGPMEAAAAQLLPNP
ncbi:MAG: hypothetical protein EBU97_05450, partial [Rhodobacteraceae bacterium]|nr:hypothetical protein [Paracoccaceae bacterium]